MEKQIIEITIETKGDVCEMTDDEIIAWYKTSIAQLFNPAYGTPQITVKLTRIPNA